MIKFLTLLLGIINRLFEDRYNLQWKQQGRQEAAKEAADEVQRQVELAEHVSVATDPEYDQRLRSRFDAAHRQQ